MVLLVLFIIVIFVEYKWSPRLDFTVDKKALLWFGGTVRNFIIILKWR